MPGRKAASSKITIVGFLGITEEKSKYVNVADGKEKLLTEIEELGDALILTGPGKDTSSFMRLSRQELDRQIGSYNQKLTLADGKLITQLSQIPEYVEVIYLYDTAEGPRVFWQEPNTSQSMN